MYKACAFARQQRGLDISNRVDQSTAVAIGTYQDVWYINDYDDTFVNDLGIVDSSGGAQLDNLNNSYINSEDSNSAGYNAGYRKRANGITSWTNTSRIELSFTGLEPDSSQTLPNSPYYNSSQSQTTGWSDAGIQPA